ncbi:MAG: DsbA family protein [Actinomycetota bacterium]|nr:DsbA family protein [Actinomycetota bacterium]
MEPADAKTFTMWADIACPWTHLAVHRWRRERARRHLEDEVRLDVRCFPLELFNRRATPKRVLDAEIPVAGGLDPDAGWMMWQRAESDYAVTTLPALEAVIAAKDQSLAASEDLDFALRRAFFGESRNISIHHEILRVAEECESVDEEELDRALRSGKARKTVFEDTAEAQSSDVIKGSPHFFASGGQNWHNPGVQMRWVGKSGEGFPLVEKDDHTIYEEMFDHIDAD